MFARRGRMNARRACRHSAERAAEQACRLRPLFVPRERRTQAIQRRSMRRSPRGAQVRNWR